MSRALLVTVGGSPDPILFSVQSLRSADPHDPLEVVFVCSVAPCPTPSLPQVVGEGLPCNHPQADGSTVAGANLLLQLDIRNFNEIRHLIGIPDPDDLADAYQRIRDHIQGMRQQNPACRMIGDYTGGTKTMSAAMAMACVEEGVEVGVVKGLRTNLLKVDHSETTRLMDIAPLHVTLRLQSQLIPILDLHNYGEAAHLVSLFQDSHGRRLPHAEPLLEQLKAAITLLEHWDHFQWKEALQQLEISQLAIHGPDLLDWWRRVVIAGICLEAKQPWLEIPRGITGYELVQDLVLSAERRGNRGWYDDAVARLYRALELLAETYITLELRIKQTGRFNAKRRCLEFFDAEGHPIDGPDSKGVANLYRWISHYERRIDRQQGLGAIYADRKSRFQKLMTARNKSLLAHGLRPLARDRWLELQDDITFFVNQMLTSQEIPQGQPPHQLPRADLLTLPAAQELFAPPIPLDERDLVRPTG